MVYIQVFIPEKNRIYDFKISTQLNIATLKSLILEAVYNVKYDNEFIRENYLFLSFNDNKKLEDDLTIDDYAIHNGEKFLLI